MLPVRQANAVFAMALAEKLEAKGSKVKAITCEPGIAETALFGNGFHTQSDVPVSGNLKAR